MTLAFRHLTVSSDSPVSEWGVEGILAAIDRGDITHWQRVASAVVADPHGQVADDLSVAIELAESEASATVLRHVLDHARETPRQRVARRIRDAIRRSGLSRTELAERIGTSASRLSTYATGKVVPSAEVMQRIDDASRHAGNGG